jgi:hypothetical protein
MLVVMLKHFVESAFARKSGVRLCIPEKNKSKEQNEKEE